MSYSNPEKKEYNEAWRKVWRYYLSTFYLRCFSLCGYSLILYFLGKISFTILLSANKIQKIPLLSQYILTIFIGFVFLGILIILVLAVSFLHDEFAKEFQDRMIYTLGPEKYNLQHPEEFRMREIVKFLQNAYEDNELKFTAILGHLFVSYLIGDILLSHEKQSLSQESRVSRNMLSKSELYFLGLLHVPEIFSSFLFNIFYTYISVTYGVFTIAVLIAASYIFHLLFSEIQKEFFA